MTNRRAGEIGSHLRALFDPGSPSGLADGPLLERVATRDGKASGLAFEALVERHGPMVLRVCRGVLRDPHDAQDAFQATFLVLFRKAGSIHDRDSVASWLHGAALRVASHARADLARRRRHERIKGEMAAGPGSSGVGDDAHARLHEELGRLPERYRAPVVLCYLEGHTCEGAAELLRWPVGTVKSRLSRARERLRRRLGRPDPGPSAMPLALPPGLARETARTAARFGARTSHATSNAIKLAEGVLEVMTLAKWKLTGLAAMAAISLLGVSIARTPASPERDPEVAQDAPDRRPRPRADELSVAPRGLTVEAGRGTILMYALNEKGERIVDPSASKPRHAGQATPENPPGPPSPAPDSWKESERDMRWIVIAGVFDHWLVRELGAEARGMEVSAFHPAYLRLGAERQTRGPGGIWSDWEAVNVDKIFEVLDNLPEQAVERTPEDVRLAALVDPLPILKKGTWSGVAPEDLLKLPPSSKAPGARPLGGMGLMTEPGDGTPKAFTLAPVIMVRFLDFTVESGQTYRYRVRVIGKDRAKEGERKRRELIGRWSEPTPDATVP